MLRSWAIPFAAMAVGIVALDGVLHLVGAGPGLFVAAITAYAVGVGCYVGRRVTAEDDAAAENGLSPVIPKAS